MNTTRSYPVILTENFFTLIGDKDYSITKSDSRFAQAISLYKAKAWDALLNLLDRPAAIARYSHGNVIVYDGVITFKGNEVHNAVADRILTFFKEGLPYEPLVAFMNNLFDNTSEGVRAKLYQFLERNNLGITEDGNVVVYKMVNEDGSPCYHQGTFDREHAEGKEQVNHYEVGQTYSFPRGQIREGMAECGTVGLYVGNKTYWGNEFDANNVYTGNGRLLIAEVRPQDVCDCAYAEASKMVVCRLTIIGEYKTLKPLVDRALVGDETSLTDGRIIEGADGNYADVNELFDELNRAGPCSLPLDPATKTGVLTEAERAFMESQMPAGGSLGYLTDAEVKELLAYAESCGRKRKKSRSRFGIKPAGSTQAGRRYHNVRKGGKFAKAS